MCISSHCPTAAAACDRRLLRSLRQAELCRADRHRTRGYEHHPPKPRFCESLIVRTRRSIRPDIRLAVVASQRRGADLGDNTPDLVHVQHKNDLQKINVEAFPDFRQYTHFIILKRERQAEHKSFLHFIHIVKILYGVFLSFAQNFCFKTCHIVLYYIFYLLMPKFEQYRLFGGAVLHIYYNERKGTRYGKPHGSSHAGQKYNLVSDERGIICMR